MFGTLTGDWRLVLCFSQLAMPGVMGGHCLLKLLRPIRGQITPALTNQKTVGSLIPERERAGAMARTDSGG